MILVMVVIESTNPVRNALLVTLLTYIKKTREVTPQLNATNLLKRSFEVPYPRQ